MASWGEPLLLQPVLPRGVVLGRDGPRPGSEGGTDAALRFPPHVPRARETTGVSGHRGTTGADRFRAHAEWEGICEPLD
jgi:hypothetical protein